MFAVFEWTKPKKRNFFARRKIKKQGAYPMIAQRYIGDIGYYVIQVEQTGHLNFDFLRSAAGREASRLLIPSDIRLPPNCGIGRYDPQSYARLLLLNGVHDLLRKAKIPVNRLRLGLFDPTARCAGAALSLLRYAESVRIMTAGQEVYEEYNERALAEYGAQLIFDNDRQVLDGCQILLAPFGMQGLHYSGTDCLIFSSNAGDPAYSVDSNCFTLPAPFEQNIPPGIDRLTFAAALHESGRISSLGAIIPQYFTQFGKIFNAFELSVHISALDNPGSTHYNVSIIQPDIDLERKRTNAQTIHFNR